LLFGRFLNFMPNGINQEFIPANFTEGRFRSSHRTARGERECQPIASISFTAVAANGLPVFVMWPALASAAEIPRNNRRPAEYRIIYPRVTNSRRCINGLQSVLRWCCAKTIVRDRFQYGESVGVFG
jgi:hypothetical protein